MKAAEAPGEGGGGHGGRSAGGGWLAGLLLFLVGLILIGGFAYPMLQRRAKPAVSDDVHDVILGRLDRIEHDLRQLDRIEGRLTLLEERQARSPSPRPSPSRGEGAGTR